MYNKLTKDSTAKTNIHTLMSFATVSMDEDVTGNQHMNGPQNIIASGMDRF